MTSEKIKLVHVLARKKGLIIGNDRELYEIHLHAVGVESCKDLKQKQFAALMKRFDLLPDAG